MENQWHLYRHLKPDGEVFYIGIGKKRYRAFSKHDRNTHWHNTVNKYGYEVQILKTKLTKEEACELEIALIVWYGRKDTGTGNLVNMTKGGDGTHETVYSKERRAEIGKRISARIVSQETRVRQSLGSVKSGQAICVDVYTLKTNEFVGTFHSINEACRVFNLNSNSAGKVLNGKRNHTGGLVFKKHNK